MNEGAGIILINSNNEVLLLLRDNNKEIPFPNQWDIPGGKVETGESPEQAVRREMKEEMGLENLDKFNHFKTYKTNDLTDHIFWKRIDLNVNEINLTEGQQIKYFSLEDIKNLKLAFNYNLVLEEFFREVVRNE